MCCKRKRKGIGGFFRKGKMNDLKKGTKKTARRYEKPKAKKLT